MTVHVLLLLAWLLTFGTEITWNIKSILKSIVYSASCKCSKWTHMSIKLSRFTPFTLSSAVSLFNLWAPYARVRRTTYSTSDGLVWQRPREKRPWIFGRIMLLSELKGTRMNKILKQGPLMFSSKIDCRNPDQPMSSHANANRNPDPFIYSNLLFYPMEKTKPLEDLSGTWNGQLNKVCGHFLEVTATTTTTL